MNRYRLVRRGILSLVLVTIIDMLVGRSVYHPLVHLYRLTSWGVCRSSLASCKYEPTQADSGQAAVSSSHHEATRVGIEVLEEGGNAVDAAVAIGYALAVVHPCCGNLGGGGFMTIQLADGTSTFINFRETAPLAATPTLYQDESGEIIQNLSTEGHLAVAVPGTVAGLEYVLEKYGSGNLNRQQLVAPAQALAEGFLLGEAEQQLFSSNAGKLKQEANVAEIFLENGQPLDEGDQLVQKDLAQTLSQIAKDGRSAFYEGAITQKIVEASQQNGGILAMEDFEAYQVEEVPPLTCNYRGFTVVTAPPPGGGTVLCQMLKIVENYPVGQAEYHSARHLHWILSAMLFAYRDRNLYLGDPNFTDIPLDNLLSEEYISSLHKQIPERNAIPVNEQLPDSPSEGQNTTHFSVVDSEGNAVSVTYTINTLFGAGVIARDTGFLLNNEMDDFTAKVGTANSYGLVQGDVNKIEPQKRPLSSMSPTIVLDENQQLYLVTGSPGGSTIPTTVFQTISNLVDFDISTEEAVNRSRIHYQGSPNVVLVEPAGISSRAFVDLWDRGYRVSPFISWGAAMSIGQQDGELQPVLDGRRAQGKAAAID